MPFAEFGFTLFKISISTRIALLSCCLASGDDLLRRYSTSDKLPCHCTAKTHSNWGPRTTSEAGDLIDSILSFCFWVPLCSLVQGHKAGHQPKTVS
jgi:hypothetical protein